MAHFKDIESFLSTLQGKIREQLPNIIAETATEFFKERFRTKEWDGSTWPQTKRIIQKGSLLVRTSSLVNSIRPSLVSADMVRISAGNGKVPYAQIHNEGGELHPKVTPAMRKWAWAKFYKENGGSVKGKKSESLKGNFYKSLALTKKTELNITIPKRQFMGHSVRLNSKIVERIKGLLND